MSIKSLNKINKRFFVEKTKRFYDYCDWAEEEQEDAVSELNVLLWKNKIFERFSEISSEEVSQIMGIGVLMGVLWEKHCSTSDLKINPFQEIKRSFENFDIRFVLCGVEYGKKVCEEGENRLKKENEVLNDAIDCSKMFREFKKENDEDK